MNPTHGAAEDPSALIARMNRAAIHHHTPCGAGTMRWRTWGTGAEPVVMLHGGFGSWLHWIRNIEPVAATRRVIAPDLPGLGDSDDLGEPVTPERLGAVVAAGLEEVCPHGRLHAVGFSFGGLVAGQVGLRLGGRLASLTLVGASGLGLDRPRIELVRREPDMTEEERLAALRENLRLLMLRHESSADPLALTIHARNDARARLKSRRMSLGSSLRAAMAGCHGTLAGIWGEHDATVGEHLEQRRALFAEVRPDSRFHAIGDAGHWVQFERADAFNATLLALLAAPWAGHRS